MYINYANNDYLKYHLKLNKKEKAHVYFHELGHVILRQDELPEGVTSSLHTEDKKEIQADCYGMIRANMILDELVYLRCHKLTPYKINTKKQILYAKKVIDEFDNVIKWVGITKLNHYKQKFKNILNNYDRDIVFYNKLKKE